MKLSERKDGLWVKLNKDPEGRGISQFIKPGDEGVIVAQSTLPDMIRVKFGYFHIFLLPEDLDII